MNIFSLIDCMCPDGVEYVELWKVTIWDKKFNGVEKEKQQKVMKYKYYFADELKNLSVSNGDIKILTTSITNLYTVDDLVKENIYENEIVCIPGGGNAVVQYYNGRFITGDNRIATSFDKNILNNKFLYYYILNNINVISSFYRGSGIKHPDMKKVLDFKIPLPPLEIQNEIVRILDRFTENVNILIQCLEKELEARKKQYEYYRDMLLSFGDDVEYVELGEVADIIMGTSPKKETFSNDENNGVEFHQGKTFFTNNVINNSNIYTSKPLKYAVKNSIVMSVRAPVGDTNITDRKIAIGRGLCSIYGKCELNTRYLYYCLKSRIMDIKRKSTNSTFESINTNEINKIKIPLPPLETQQKIVEILDRFNSLCNDISEGIPAEIEARKKQYEYYRDKLLNFKAIQ